MKKIIKTVMFAVAVVAAGFGGVKAYDVSTVNENRLIAENIEALSGGGDGDSGSGETVKCYCKKHTFSPNVCTADGDGAYCGGDPCSNHDGNCR